MNNLYYTYKQIVTKLGINFVKTIYVTFRTSGDNIPKNQTSQFY